MRAFLIAVLIAACLISTAWAVKNDAFTDNGDGTVTDNKKGLIWQKENDGRKRPWNESHNYCRGLSLGGHSDWRLPSMEELSSFWQNAASKSEIRETYFPSMKSSEASDPVTGMAAPYWSSTHIAVSGQDGRGFVDFGDGGLHVAAGNMFSFYARCVRLGK